MRMSGKALRFLVGEGKEDGLGYPVKRKRS